MYKQKNICCELCNLFETYLSNTIAYTSTQKRFITYLLDYVSIKYYFSVFALYALSKIKFTSVQAYYAGQNTVQCLQNQNISYMPSANPNMKLITVYFTINHIIHPIKCYVRPNNHVQILTTVNMIVRALTLN